MVIDQRSDEQIERIRAAIEAEYKGGARTTAFSLLLDWVALVTKDQQKIARRIAEIEATR